MMRVYLDDSHDTDSTMCIGGWLGYQRDWDNLENEWKKEIEIENKDLTKVGLKPITRYHATDCAGTKKRICWLG